VAGKEGTISNPWIDLDGYFKLELPGTFDAGNSIVCDGKSVRLYNKKGGFMKEIPVQQAIPVLKPGRHVVKFDCEFQEDSELTVGFVVKTRSNPEIIQK
jgi:hypothetical protein